MAKKDSDRRIKKKTPITFLANEKFKGDRKKALDYILKNYEEHNILQIFKSKNTLLQEDIEYLVEKGKAEYDRILSEQNGDRNKAMVAFMNDNIPLFMIAFKYSDFFTCEDYEYIEQFMVYHSILVELCSQAKVGVSDIRYRCNPYVKPLAVIISAILLCVFSAIFAAEYLSGIFGKNISEIIFKFTPILISCTLIPLAAKILKRFSCFFMAKEIAKRMDKARFPLLFCVSIYGIFGIGCLAATAMLLFSGGKDAYVLSVLYLLIGGPLMIFEHIIVYDSKKGIFKHFFRDVLLYILILIIHNTNRIAMLTALAVTATTLYILKKYRKSKHFEKNKVKIEEVIGKINEFICFVAENFRGPGLLISFFLFLLSMNPPKFLFFIKNFSILFACISLFLFIWCIVKFFRDKTAPAPFEKYRGLVLFAVWSIFCLSLNIDTVYFSESIRFFAFTALIYILVSNLIRFFVNIRIQKFTSVKHIFLLIAALIPISFVIIISTGILFDFSLIMLCGFLLYIGFILIKNLILKFVL